ncbi:phage replisome organizer N-terminal domain-containing protein [Clostridium oceanicum]|uniref:DnaD domain protein n=1 Tax=Clostridium oceanicum TaxID=1543 RepID=A0ABN1JC47_9CLOT
MTKKYYWLKLKEDFFEEDTIQWLEEQENGKDYCLFYLKLCLKSLKSNGVLIRNVGQILVPYDIKKLADITNTKPDTVIVAMEIFKKIGLVQVLENGEIYMTQLENMVGSESEWAKKKRKQRLKSKHKDNVPNLSPQCPTEIEKEIELDNRNRDRDRDEEKEENKLSSTNAKKFSDVIGIFNNNIHMVTPLECEKLKEWSKDITYEVIIKAIEESVYYNKRSMGYINAILNNWFNNNLKSIEDVKAYLRDRDDKRGVKHNAGYKGNNKKPEDEGIGIII